MASTHKIVGMLDICNIKVFALRGLAAAIALVVAWAVLAAPVVVVEEIRTWAAPDHTRVVLDLSNRVGYKYFQLQNPRRLVIDLLGADMAKPQALPKISGRDLFLKRIRHGLHKESLRLVLDLKSEVSPDVFVLEPHQHNSHRMVIDLFESQQKVSQISQKATPSPPLPSPDAATTGSSQRKTLQATGKDMAKRIITPPLSTKQKLEQEGVRQRLGAGREVVVVVDAGHGGEDKGATGRRQGIYEKDVVLQIAKKLATLIDASPDMRAILVRDGDYFVTLGDRVRMARVSKADIFVSIHADSFKDPEVNGASVYVLSRQRATSEHARWLADRENASDLVGGVNIAARDDLLAAVLLDLSQTAALQASSEAAKDIASSMGKVSHMHKQRVEAASFMVLGAPDIPSVLVETGFISNSDDESRLLDDGYQHKVAQSIFSGLYSYFSRRPPENSSFASLAAKR